MRSATPYEKFGKADPLGDASLRIHVFTASDTISLLADRFYGDWTLWRLIADRNSISDVRQISPGTKLIIPGRPQQVGGYEST